MTLSKNNDDTLVHSNLARLHDDVSTFRALALRDPASTDERGPALEAQAVEALERDRFVKDVEADWASEILHFGNRHQNWKYIKKW